LICSFGQLNKTDIRLFTARVTAKLVVGSVRNATFLAIINSISSLLEATIMEVATLLGYANVGSG
jgi:hypothetical protein